ncbi:class I SAM-dependent methyltransferase [Gordonia sp. (in: high G+C Gram-positive bacteria)]|uniref:class I SAM-dependent methyltransferase n=1 Tax=Gordonia sp. (in: high G+C Gram-positive bacteria) TaxID=84139 RepID=UPI0039E56DD0
MTEDSAGLDNGGPSRTALVTAQARAQHQIVDRPLILDDPLAIKLVGTPADELAAGAPEPGTVEDPAIRPRRLFFAARSRFAEDVIADGYASGTRQAVVLGAGLDTFAYRNPHAGLRVFEVDHPASQAWKRERLAAAGIDIPATAALVPVDFETDDLADRLRAAGFSRTEPAVFVWLGVVYYLTAEAADVTLGFIAEQARPADVVFDYLTPPTTGAERERLAQRATRVAAAGEPWFSLFTPDEIAGRLHALGFTQIDDRSAADLVDGYLGTTEFATTTPDAIAPSRILRART